MNRFEDNNWCEKMRIHLDFNNVMVDFIGDKEGIKQSQFENLSEKIWSVRKKAVILYSQNGSNYFPKAKDL